MVASDPEEKVMTAIMMLACVTGSVLILKTNFMSKTGRETEGRRKKRARRECWIQRSRERKATGTITTTL
jgi:hypothetical protein